MIHFLLNDKEVNTNLPPGTLLLDFIRYHKNLTGTKIGCREGDCGACTVLVGEIKDAKLVYHSATSCLMAIGNANGKHIVTVEGINVDGLNFIQQSFVEEGATQCGFCTPGFIVSLAGFCLNNDQPLVQKGMDAVNGNICRCTGYKSIERAIDRIETKLSGCSKDNAIEFAVAQNILPAYFLNVKEKLAEYIFKSNGVLQTSGNKRKYLAGGTDLYVQQHDAMTSTEIDFLFDKTHLNGIEQKDDACFLGAAVTVSDIAASPVFQKHFPRLQEYIKLVSSTQIRNMATIAGNFVNASPIGDLTIFFLALNAQLILTDGASSKEVALRNFYRGYKMLNKSPEDHIKKIYFKLPSASSRFNFEKICKRTHLDIASVNSAIYLEMADDTIKTAGLAAGGVGPVPSFLNKTSSFLEGKKIDICIIDEAVKIAQSEISPISDARGTATYKRFLLEQLIKAHFIKLFPQLPVELLVQQ